MTQIEISIIGSNPKTPAWFKNACLQTLKKTKISKKNKFELNIVFASNKKIQSLNKKYRNKDKPTNVLSFPAYDPKDIYPAGFNIPLGDIVLSLPTIKREAKEQGKTFDDHLRHLVIHGLLHLVGYDHENDKDAKKMETLEISILKQMGIKNPYIL